MKTRLIPLLVIACAILAGVIGNQLPSIAYDKECRSDLDGDSDVDLLDVMAFKDDYGATNLDCNEPDPMAELHDMIAECRNMIAEQQERDKKWQVCFDEWQRATGFCDPLTVI